MTDKERHLLETDIELADKILAVLLCKKAVEVVINESGVICYKLLLKYNISELVYSAIIHNHYLFEIDWVEDKNNEEVKCFYTTNELLNYIIEKICEVLIQFNNRQKELDTKVEITTFNRKLWNR